MVCDRLMFGDEFCDVEGGYGRSFLVWVIILCFL